jgi:poly(3-hydroxybutyrate) depolymerase
LHRITPFGVLPFSWFSRNFVIRLSLKELRVINFHTMKQILLLTSILVFSFSGHAFDGTGSISSGSQNRTFAFHAPGNAVAENLPIVIIMHGDGGTGAGIKGYAGFDAIADAENFIAVYPDAIASSWNRYADNVPGDAGLGNPNAPDDVQFISDLIDYFCDTYHINKRKVYATGHSAGGFMAYNLSVSLTDKIAAFAPVAASLWGETAYLNNYFTNGYVQVPIYHIHGDADNVVDYPDPDHAPTAYQEWPLTAFSPGNCNNSSYVSTVDIVPNVKNLVYCDGLNTNGKKVSLIRIVGGGHGWPNVANYNAAQAIWDFFELYELDAMQTCAEMSVEENIFANLTIKPVPVNDMLTIENIPLPININIVDATGRLIVSKKQMQTQTLDVNALVSGAYFITITSDGRSKTVKFIKQ